MSRPHLISHLDAVMLSEALQRNAKHEARLSNISVYCQCESLQNWSELLRFAQNDITRWFL